MTIFVGTGLVNKEIEKRTILMLIAKPVSRSEFIAGKFLGLSAVLTVIVAAMTAIFLGCMQIAKISYSLPSIAIASVFLLLQLCLLGAVAITMGVFTSSLLATALTFGVYLMGNIPNIYSSLAVSVATWALNVLPKLCILYYPIYRG